MRERLNIDVVATTGQFEAAMKRVRQNVATTAKVASKGASIGGGMNLGPVGAVGGLAMLSGPFLAIGAGMAALSLAIRAMSDQLAKGDENLSEIRTLGLLPETQADLRRIGGGIREGATASDAMAIRDSFEKVAADMGLVDTTGMDIGSAFEEIAKAARGPNALAIAEAMGGKGGADFMRMRSMAPGSFAGAAAETTTTEAAVRALMRERLRSRHEMMNDPNDTSAITLFLQWLKEWAAAQRPEIRDAILDPRQAAELERQSFRELQQMNQNLQATGPGI